MGMMMSLVGMGKVGMPPTTHMFNMLTGTLYNQFLENDIKSFEHFHSAILDIFSIINSALPGKHYDVPSRKEIEICFKKWQESSESERKDVFVNFVKERVHLSKLDNFTLIAGVTTPPAAMAAKKAGQNVPQIRFIKAIPDVIFVPSITVLALISAKLSRKMIQGNSASKMIQGDSAS